MLSRQPPSGVPGALERGGRNSPCAQRVLRLRRACFTPLVSVRSSLPQARQARAQIQAQVQEQVTRALRQRNSDSAAMEGYKSSIVAGVTAANAAASAAAAAAGGARAAGGNTNAAMAAVRGMLGAGAADGGVGGVRTAAHLEATEKVPCRFSLMMKSKPSCRTARRSRVNPPQVYPRSSQRALLNARGQARVTLLPRQEGLRAACQPW